MAEYNSNMEKCCPENMGVVDSQANCILCSKQKNGEHAHCNFSSVHNNIPLRAWHCPHLVDEWVITLQCGFFVWIKIYYLAERIEEVNEC